MRISLPYSKKRRYLSGNDWSVAAFHHATRRLTGVGNLSQIVLELGAHLDEVETRAHLDTVVRRYPLLHGWIERDITLCPYWRIPRNGSKLPPALLTANGLPAYREFGDVALLRALEDAVNTPFKTKRQHVAFSILNLPDGTSRFVMTFDHRLFDARGAEMFLQLMQAHFATPSLKPDPRHLNPVYPAHLDNWKEKFLAGQKVNRFFLELSSMRMAVLNPPGSIRDVGYRFRALSFNAAQSRTILAHAHAKAGYLMVTPYLLGTIAQGVDHLFTQCGVRDCDFLVPVSTDARKAGAPEKEVFFNHVAFMFFRLSASNMHDRDALIAQLKSQMYEQVKTELPKHMDQASMLMRILPPSILATTMHMPLHGRKGSFGFSYLGESAFTSPEFMGRPVRNLIHMPRVTVPPAIGAFCNLHDGQLNFVFSYIDGMTQETHADALVATIERRLLQDASENLRDDTTP